MNRVHSGNKFNIIQSIEEVKIKGWIRSVLHKLCNYSRENTTTVLSLHVSWYWWIHAGKAKHQFAAKSLCEEDANTQCHCRNSCISCVCSLQHTAHVAFADMSLQSWYCSEAYTMDDKDYLFLLYCFTNDNTIVLLKPSLSQIRGEVHFTHNTMNWLITSQAAHWMSARWWMSYILNSCTGFFK